MNFNLTAEQEIELIKLRNECSSLPIEFLRGLLVSKYQFALIEDNRTRSVMRNGTLKPEDLVLSLEQKFLIKTAEVGSKLIYSELEIIEMIVNISKLTYIKSNMAKELASNPIVNSAMNG